MNNRVIQKAELLIIKHVQRQHFESEINDIMQTGSTKPRSKLHKLMPCIVDDMLVVGGRVSDAVIDERSKHQYIIPHDHPIALLIVKDEHNVAHLGREWVLSSIRRRFWIIKARKLTYEVSRDCMICKKKFRNAMQQRMANLPIERLDWQRPVFTNVGVDCFGPYHVTYRRGTVKRYGCIYTCLSSRAIQLEKLESLEADAFINALRRFVARRGLPEKMFSDNGTNIVCCYKEAKTFVEVTDTVTKRTGIEWCFNPPTASHMGGAWERLIRVIRKIMTGMLNKNMRLTDDVLETLFCEIENIINGRPMTKLSSVVDDRLPLTPNHLPMIRSCSSRIMQSFNRGDMYRKQWRYVQHMTDVFWKRWLREYLPELQRRSKWRKEKRNVAVGDLVLVMDELTPRNVWPMGMVYEINTGRDGLVRSVRVRTAATVLVRPITKLVMLEGDLDE